MTEKLNLQGSIKAKSANESKLSIRTSLTLQYLKAAILFANKAKEIENTKTTSDDIILEHQSYITMTIISSVMLLEASINEFISDIKTKTIYNELSTNLKIVYSNIEKIINKSSSTLDKYQLILVSFNKNLFNPENDNIYKNIDDLIKLRNALIHYEPMFNTKENTLHKSIEKRFRSKNLEINPFSNSNDEFFPKKWASSNLAFWAIQSACSFLKIFFYKFEIQNHLYNYIESLTEHFAGLT